MAIVGSGCAGSILARALHRQGHAVYLCERGAHPRFAIGESSTPLAALSLERLAARYDLEDLHALAAYGRWMERLPHLRRGLKRGFTFFAHPAGRPYENDSANDHRLLVAASPSDAEADSHWLREDVDAHLAERAAEEGVELLDRTELEDARPRPGGFRLEGRRLGRPIRLDVDLVVDASGAGGFLAGRLPIPPHPTPRWPRTGLLFGHFAGMAPFETVARRTGAELPPGPYPDERAAVHHLLTEGRKAEGWMYVLPFDHGVVSAGLVLSTTPDGEPPPAALDPSTDPGEAWSRVLARYPTIEAQFAAAEPVRPIERLPRLQRRLERASGPAWAVLPHGYCFLSPLYSTGIAWSLRAVERIARALEPFADSAEGGPSGVSGRLETALARYGTLLAREADHLGRLMAGAYRLLADFDRFVDYSFLYFAAVSFQEARQRLRSEPPDGWAWEGFLGAEDPVIRRALARASEAIGERAGRSTAEERRRFGERIRRDIEPRNVAGLFDDARNRLYPVELQTLVEGAPLLGLTADLVRERLDRLRV